MCHLNVPINDFFSFSTVTPDELTVVMNGLKSSSPGYDDSSYKNNIDILGEIILHICDKSLSRGIFPDQMNWDKKYNGNYRPISVPNSLSKII